MERSPYLGGRRHGQGQADDDVPGPTGHLPRDGDRPQRNRSQARLDSTGKRGLGANQQVPVPPRRARLRFLAGVAGHRWSGQDRDHGHDAVRVARRDVPVPDAGLQRRGRRALVPGGAGRRGRRARGSPGQRHLRVRGLRGHARRPRAEHRRHQHAPVRRLDRPAGRRRELDRGGAEHARRHGRQGPGLRPRDLRTEGSAGPERLLRPLGGDHPDPVRGKGDEPLGLRPNLRRSRRGQRRDDGAQGPHPPRVRPRLAGAAAAREDDRRRHDPSTTKRSARTQEPRSPTRKPERPTAR